MPIVRAENIGVDNVQVLEHCPSTWTLSKHLNIVQVLEHCPSTWTLFKYLNIVQVLEHCPGTGTISKYLDNFQVLGHGIVDAVHNKIGARGGRSRCTLCGWEVNLLLNHHTTPLLSCLLLLFIRVYCYYCWITTIPVESNSNKGSIFILFWAEMKWNVEFILNSY